MLAPRVDKGRDTVTERDLRRIPAGDGVFGRLVAFRECCHFLSAAYIAK